MTSIVVRCRWSLGTLIYEMLCGAPPFYDTNRQVMYQKIMKGTLRFRSFMSDDVQDLITRLLARKDSERLGSGPGDANDIKVHPWFHTYKGKSRPTTLPATRAMQVSNSWSPCLLLLLFSSYASR